MTPAMLNGWPSLTELSGGTPRRARVRRALGAGSGPGKPPSDAMNPGALYAGAAGKLFQTTDGAGHWSRLGGFSGTVLVVDPQNSKILYGTGPSKSTDGGLTWNAIGSIPTAFPPCVNPGFVIDPTTLALFTPAAARGASLRAPTAAARGTRPIPPCQRESMCY